MIYGGRGRFLDPELGEARFIPRNSIYPVGRFET